MYIVDWDYKIIKEVARWLKLGRQISISWILWKQSMLKRMALCYIVGSWIRNEWSEPGFTGLNDLQD
jgi:hypothetical protein